MLTNPVNCQIGVALPNAATVHHVPDWSLGGGGGGGGGHTVQVPTQLATAMPCYEPISY